jgi:hypothetical protein
VTVVGVRVIKAGYRLVAREFALQLPVWIGPAFHGMTSVRLCFHSTRVLLFAINFIKASHKLLYETV